MQIDFHHTCTYIAARNAGFSHDDAAKIAYAAQYVDDATNSGPVIFQNSEFMYSRIASAHSMLDSSNLVDYENHMAWIPFHFIPGNCGIPIGQTNKHSELERLKCTPDSPIAKDMLHSALKDKNTPRELHRLGIAMHVYADTFAHQGFVGALCAANRASYVTSGDLEIDKSIIEFSSKSILTELFGKIKTAWKLFTKAIEIIFREKKNPISFIKDFLEREPVGHAAVNSFPDQPYITWSYVNDRKQTIKRDNTETFITAMDAMTRAMGAWVNGASTINFSAHIGLDAKDAELTRTLFKQFKTPDGHSRHTDWIQALKTQQFSFGPVSLDYIDKGPKSWKQLALGTQRTKDTGFEEFQYSENFLRSDWKLFHDALQAHRNDVLHEILPRYGLCAG